MFGIFEKIKTEVFFASLPCLVLCALAAGCSTRASLSLNADNSAYISFKTRGGKTLEETAGALTGTSEGAVLFDEKKVKDTFAAAGFTVTELTLSGKTGITVSAHTRDIGASGAAAAVRRESGINGESLVLTFDSGTIRSLMSLLPAETSEYSEFLMAPLFTGESMNESEYAELIGAMYGKAVRAELEAAFFICDITVPAKITEAAVEPAETGSVHIEGKKAEFRISLNKFLSNSEKIKICIYWKN